MPSMPAPIPVTEPTEVIEPSAFTLNSSSAPVPPASTCSLAHEREPRAGATNPATSPKPAGVTDQP